MQHNNEKKLKGGKKELKGPSVQQGLKGMETSLSNSQVSYHVWQAALRPTVI